MKLALIAAVARNRGIGYKGELPWRLPEDMRRFKQMTTGHAVLMGRKTFEALGKPLPNRRNVVLTHRALPGIETYAAIDAALAALANEQRVFVIGGGEIYAQLLDNADELYLTHVQRDVTADAFFPPFEHLIGTRFREIFRDDRDEFSFVDYLRT
ncbi:MAG: dfrA [Bacteroidetes bacterium]|nr:dfrA [Bacteroidota bacterium]